MKTQTSLDVRYTVAVQAIKTAILRSQYQAIKLVNKEQLALYFGVGRYISQNSRKGYWGTGAIAYISNRLRAELPGLRGFSETNLKLMRIFYEEWSMLDINSSVPTDELSEDEYKLPNEECAIMRGSIISQNVEKIRQSGLTNLTDFPFEAFFNIGFTHHIAILSQTKILEQRYFYINVSSMNYKFL